jgi:hypothetical protein
MEGGNKDTTHAHVRRKAQWGTARVRGVFLLMLLSFVTEIKDGNDLGIAGASAKCLKSEG